MHLVYIEIHEEDCFCIYLLYILALLAFAYCKLVEMDNLQEVELEARSSGMALYFSKHHLVDLDQMEAVYKALVD
jgi:hypothetical protein